MKEIKKLLATVLRFSLAWLEKGNYATQNHPLIGKQYEPGQIIVAVTSDTVIVSNSPSKIRIDDEETVWLENGDFINPKLGKNKVTAPRTIWWHSLDAVLIRLEISREELQEMEAALADEETEIEELFEFESIRNISLHDLRANIVIEDSDEPVATVTVSGARKHVTKVKATRDKKTIHVSGGPERQFFVQQVDWTLMVKSIFTSLDVQAEIEKWIKEALPTVTVRVPKETRINVYKTEGAGYIDASQSECSISWDSDDDLQVTACGETSIYAKAMGNVAVDQVSGNFSITNNSSSEITVTSVENCDNLDIDNSEFGSIVFQNPILCTMATIYNGGDDSIVLNGLECHEALTVVISGYGDVKSNKSITAQNATIRLTDSGDIVFDSLVCQQEFIYTGEEYGGLQCENTIRAQNVTVTLNGSGGFDVQSMTCDEHLEVTLTEYGDYDVERTCAKTAKAILKSDGGCDFGDGKINEMLTVVVHDYGSFDFNGTAENAMLETKRDSDGDITIHKVTQEPQRVWGLGDGYISIGNWN